LSCSRIARCGSDVVVTLRERKSIFAHRSSARRARDLPTLAACILSRSRIALYLIARYRSLRIALWSPPTSSSLGDEKHVPSILLTTAARNPGFNCSLPLAADCALESAYFVLSGRAHSALVARTLRYLELPRRAGNHRDV
jgi:hypothetical protein